MLMLYSSRRFRRLLQLLLGGEHAFAGLRALLHVVDGVVVRARSQSLKPGPRLLLSFA